MVASCAWRVVACTSKIAHNPGGHTLVFPATALCEAGQFRTRGGKVPGHAYAGGMPRKFAIEANGSTG